MRNLNFIATLIVFISYIIIVSNFKLDGDDSTLEIASSQDIFEVIDNNTLQLTGNPSKIFLSCHSAPDRKRRVIWRHYESKLYSHNIGFSRKVNNNFHNMSIGFTNGMPPLVRVECHLKDFKVSRNMFIYTGVNGSPYIYKNKETIKAIPINETMVVLPCLLKCPIGHTGSMALELFKDGDIIRNANYVPEHGYFLDLTNTKNQSFGLYKCMVLNSTNDDYVHVEVNEGSFLDIKYKGYNQHVFHEGSTEKQPFECTAPKSMFNEGFRWHYRMTDGSLVEFTPEREIATELSPSLFTDSIQTTFETWKITHVVCTSESKESGVFNASLPVKVLKTTLSVTLKDPGLKRIQYAKGTWLNCTAVGFRVNFRWLKDGQNVTNADIHDSSPSTNVSTTSLSLQPLADDLDTNYTCCAFNQRDQACKSFIVKVNNKSEIPTPTPTWPVYTLATALVIIAFGIGTILAFCRLSFSRRNLFPNSEIKKFLRGFTPIAGEPRAFSKSFDKDKIIADECIRIDENMNIGQGNYGIVEFGWLVMKDQPDRRIRIAKKKMKLPEKQKEEQEKFHCWPCFQPPVKEKTIAFNSFLNEIKLHASLEDHPNVVKLIGATATTKNLKNYQTCAILEYCHEGDLDSYLERHAFHFDNSDIGGPYRSYDSDFKVKTIHLIKWARDIAAGMEFLSSKNIVHMDIAARNIMLACKVDVEVADDLVAYRSDPELLIAKIGDLGLSKNLNGRQYIRLPRDQYLPLAYYSADAIKDKKFYQETDIWSIGLLYYKMFNLGNSLKDREQRPPFAPPEMWEIIKMCLSEEPSARPSCTAIRLTLEDMLASFTDQMPESEPSSSALSEDEVVRSSETLSLASSKESESVEVDASREKAWDKSPFRTFSVAFDIAAASQEVPSKSDSNQDRDQNERIELNVIIHKPNEPLIKSLALNYCKVGEGNKITLPTLP